MVANVGDELFWDPKVDSAAIAVSADGTVEWQTQRDEAEFVAPSIASALDNEIEITPPAPN